MLLQSVLLFLSALLGGMGVLVMPKLKPATFKLVLVFAGSYLFSITVLHLLPDLFSFHPLTTRVGFYVLIGFFLQLFLGFFSKGVEHGHMYEAQQEDQHRSLSPLALFTSLCIHAFLDGVILSNTISAHLHHTHTTNRLLVGIILHKASECFALVSVLSGLMHKKKIITLYLLFFSLTSPLGLWISRYCTQQCLLTKEGFIALAAIASGNFLHISTTIFFESSPHHRFSSQRLIASLAGAGLVVLLEYLL